MRMMRKIEYALLYCIPLVVSAKTLSVKVSVPDWRVVKTTCGDSVVIEGAGYLAIEHGRPKVPCVTKSVELGRDARVASVVLRAKAPPRNDSGLSLVPVNFDTMPVPAAAIKSGMYPDKDFDWYVVPSNDSAKHLAIAVYPFHNDPMSSKTVFYNEFSFDVTLASTDLTLLHVNPVRTVYEPGETVRVTVHVSNTGKPQDGLAELSVFPAGAGVALYRKSPARLARIGARDSTVLSWPTTKDLVGPFDAEVAVRDAGNVEAGRERVRVVVGTPRASVARLSATPSCFRLGEPVELEMELDNTGPCTLTGECVMEVSHEGTVATTFRRPVESLAPGSARVFRDTWQTRDASKGVLYYLTGYAAVNGTTSDVKSVALSTNLQPDARLAVSAETLAVDQELQCDAMKSVDRDGSILEYAWEFGDGGSDKGEKVKHSYAQPGEYRVVLTVTDNEGGTGTTQKVVVVIE